MAKAKLPNGLEVQDREYAATEVVGLVLDATARELAGCIEAIQGRREKANVDAEADAVGAGLKEAILTLQERARDLGIPHLVDSQVTRPLDIAPQDGESES